MLVAQVCRLFDVVRNTLLIWQIATISIAYGVVADIASPAERGSFVGAVLCGSVILMLHSCYDGFY